MGSCTNRCSQGVSDSDIQMITQQCKQNKAFLSMNIQYQFDSKQYLPLKSEVVMDSNHFSLVYCEIIDFAYKIIPLEIRLDTRQQKYTSPFVTLIHYWEANDQNLIDRSLNLYMDELKSSLCERLTQSLPLEDIWKLIDCISDVMYKLQLNKHYIGGISSNIIYEVDTPFRMRVFKIHDWNWIEDKQRSHFYNSWLAQYKKNHIVDHQQLFKILPSPSLLKNIVDGIQFPKINYYKMDVFGFGILLLQCFESRDILPYLYNNFDLTLDLNLINTLIDKVPHEYQELVSFILELDDDKRMDWIQLKDYINTKYRGQSILDKYDLEQFYYGNLQKQQKNSLPFTKFINNFQDTRIPSNINSRITPIPNQNSQQNNNQVQFDVNRDITIMKHGQQFIQICKTYEPLWIDQNYQEDQNECMGILTQEDGSQYRGQLDQVKHGQGEIINAPNQIQIRGQFSMGNLHGQATLTNMQISQFLAYDHTNVGLVEQHWKTFDGEFVDGAKQGTAQIQFSNGNKFEGLFKNNLADGDGVYIYSDGKVVEGKWDQNIYKQTA